MKREEIIDSLEWDVQLAKNLFAMSVGIMSTKMSIIARKF